MVADLQCFYAELVLIMGVMMGVVLHHTRSAHLTQQH
jgi:hypothetical protein